MYRPQNSMAWTRTLIAWTLLALAPLTGVRLVCVTEPVRGSSIQPSDPLACQTICSRHPRASYRTRCALVDDPSCAFALGTTAAVLPDGPAVPFTMTAEPLECIDGSACAHPPLDRGSPPPKA